MGSLDLHEADAIHAILSDLVDPAASLPEAAPRRIDRRR
jgi:hypothetical protein